MDDILRYKPKPEDDFYHLLGCDELSTKEQILCEYKARVTKCHPDKNLDNELAAEEFACLVRAKDILANPDTKKLYDMWRHSGIAMGFNDWMAIRNKAHMSLHWGVKAQKTPMIESGQETDDNQLAAAAAATPNGDQTVKHVQKKSLVQRFRDYEI